MLALCLMMLDSEEEKKNFEDFVKKYEKKMYYMAYKILKSHESSEEAVWDAFYYVAKHFKTISRLPVYKMEAYLILTVKTSSYKIYNKEKKNYGSIDIGVMRSIPDFSEFDKYDAVAVTNAINELDEKHKAVIAYFFYYGHSASDIAEIMGISRSTVYKYLREAKRILSKKLK